MSASFHIDAGPFVIHVDLDDTGIRMSRNALGRAHTESIPWNRITGATIVLPDEEDRASEQEERIAQSLGPEAAAKFNELQGQVGQICVAYRDERNRLQQTDL